MANLPFAILNQLNPDSGIPSESRSPRSGIMPYRLDAHDPLAAIRTAESTLQFFESVNAGRFVRAQLAGLAARSATAARSNLKMRLAPLKKEARPPDADGKIGIPWNPGSRIHCRRAADA